MSRVLACVQRCWPIFSRESRYVSFRSLFFFPFSVRGQGPGTRRLYVTSCCTARKSTERETCRIFPDYHALKSVHLQNLTPSRNLVSHVHKGTVAIIFRSDCRKTNSSHEQSVDFDFFSFLFLIACLSLKGDVSLIYSLGI